MKFLARLLLLTTMLLAPALQAADPTTPPVYELRIYTTNEGKLPSFCDHTCGLFEKHDITNIGYWVPIEKENGADTTLSHKSCEAAKASCATFGKDPAWKTALAASKADGSLTILRLKATDFSPIQ